MSDLQSFAKNFTKLTEELKATTSVPFNVLFNDYFMNTYTNFKTIDAFLTTLGIDPSDNQGFDAYPEDKLDIFVNKETKFFTWQEMLEKAFEEYLIDKYSF